MTFRDHFSAAAEHYARHRTRYPRALANYYRDTVGAYWPERIHYLDERYRTLPFPFEEIAPRGFAIEAQWDLGAFTGFLFSWSVTRRCLEANGRPALEPSLAGLAERWGREHVTRSIRWPWTSGSDDCPTIDRPSPSTPGGDARNRHALGAQPSWKVRPEPAILVSYSLSNRSACSGVNC